MNTVRMLMIFGIVYIFVVSAMIGVGLGIERAYNRELAAKRYSVPPTCRCRPVCDCPVCECVERQR